MANTSPFAWPTAGASRPAASIDDFFGLYGLQNQLAGSDLSPAQQGEMLDLLRQTAEYHEYKGASPREAVELAATDFNNLAASNRWRDLMPSPDEIVVGTVTAGALEGRPASMAQGAANPPATENQAAEDAMPDFSNDPLMKKGAKYWSLYQKYGRQYGIDPRLLMAQGGKESTFDPNTYVKGTEAYGLGQVTPDTAKEVGESWEAQNDPETSIRTQAAYLARLRDHYKFGSTREMLMAYLDGPGNMRKKEPSRSVQAYADAIIAIYNRYRLPPPPPPRPEPPAAVHPAADPFAPPEPQVAPTRPLPGPPPPRPLRLRIPQPGQTGLGSGPILDDPMDPNQSLWAGDDGGYAF